VSTSDVERINVADGGAGSGDFDTFGGSGGQGGRDLEFSPEVERLTQSIGSFIATCVELSAKREPWLQGYLAVATTTAVALANGAVSGTTCPVVAQPAATIRVGFDPGHNMRWECTHASPPGMHCWDYGSGVHKQSC
jgi:hypothetical protein